MQPNMNSNQMNIDVMYLARAVIRNLLLIIFCGWIGTLVGFMSADYVNAPKYNSSAYMIIRYKENPEALLSGNTISKVAAQFQKTFTSTVMDSMLKEVMEQNDLEGDLTAKVVGGTNILVVNASAVKPLDAFAIVKTAIQNYTKVTDYVISDYYLEEIKSPTVSTVSGVQKSHIHSAILGGLLGGALSMGLIVLLAFFKDDIKNEDQIELLLDTERFATIFYEKKRRKRKKKGILIGDRAVSFLYTENVRKMATRLIRSTEDEEKKVILITSVQENEGKSTIAANLALSLAAQNKKVLLIDADLCNPAMYKLFEKKLTEEQEIGGYLYNKNTIQNVLTKENDSGLYYLFGSKAYRDSDKLLLSEQMEKLLEATRNSMDYIIIDSAPLTANNDAEILCRLVDGALLVVRQGYSRVPMVNEALDTLRNNKADVLGCVYNAVQTRLLPKATEYGYHYGYYYGYGYGKYKKRYGNYDIKR